MSTNSSCEFFIFKGQHFYVLEDYNAPKNAWDWHDHATTYGPFSTQAAAQRDLQDNHANPGGWCECGDVSASASYAKLVKEATPPHRSQSYGGHYLGWRPRR